MQGTWIGSYHVDALVDEGEFSAVYRATHAVLGSSHALKVAHGNQELLIIRALHTAASLQARVVHPNVVRVTDAGTWQGRPWLVMDWIEGRSLENWLEQRGALAIDRAINLFRGIVRGVHALHAEGIVHRDLKPANVLVGRVRGRHAPMVSDLGLAKKLDPTRPGPQGLSLEYRVLGTPEYMAPEQSLNVSDVDGRADLWSLGVLLYELVTDALPFEGERRADIHRLATAGRYPPLRAWIPEAPEELEALVGALLAPNPDKRLPSTDLLLRWLDRL